VAGFVGGSTLTFFWPLLFYLNMRAGSWAQNRRTPVEDPAAVTDQTISALAWGSTFAVGAILNSLLVGLTVYVLLRLLYQRTRRQRWLISDNTLRSTSARSAFTVNAPRNRLNEHGEPDLTRRRHRRPHPAMILPFAVVLLAIALMPFINLHWWERHFPKVAKGLGAVTTIYYVFAFAMNNTGTDG
jgi:Putative citrate transport/Uncharacterized protein conserved in bacteria (DUF2062)